jgi:hypothetical protein
MSLLRGITFLDMPDQEAQVIDSLTLNQFHEICYRDLSRYRTITISNDVTVNLGAVFACSPSDQFEDWREIVSLPYVGGSVAHWCGAKGEVMENGWTR